MELISEKIQMPGRVPGTYPKLFARDVGSGEVGILIGYEVESLDGPQKRTCNAIYWDDREQAVEDLKKVIAFFEGDEDEDVIMFEDQSVNCQDAPCGNAPLGCADKRYCPKE